MQFLLIIVPFLLSAKWTPKRGWRRHGLLMTDENDEQVHTFSYMLISRRYLRLCVLDSLRVPRARLRSTCLVAGRRLQCRSF